MASKKFTSKRISNVIHAAAGAGSVTVPVTFVPDFFRVKFQDVAHVAAGASVNYVLNSTGIVESPYELVIHWSTPSPRTIKYVVAELPTDSEQTIAFSHG